MEQVDDRVLEFYIAASGRSPVEDFLRDLDEKARGRCRWSLEQLRGRNRNARAPLVRHLEGTPWGSCVKRAARISIASSIALFSGRRIVLLHRFQKKTQQTPRKEIGIAAERYREFSDRERRRRT